MVAVVLLAGTSFHAAEARQAADVDVPVYIDNQGGADLSAVHLSMAIASKMFHRIGVTLVWVNSSSCPPEAIFVSLTSDTPATLQPGSLAYARPYEGTHIRVFLDRVEASNPALVPHLLAHVLAHEIIHALEGCSRHSDRGLMKAHWDGVDLAHMLWNELPIMPEDADLAHLGIDKRAQLAAANRKPGRRGRQPGFSAGAVSASVSR